MTGWKNQGRKKEKCTLEQKKNPSVRHKCTFSGQLFCWGRFCFKRGWDRPKRSLLLWLFMWEVKKFFSVLNFSWAVMFYCLKAKDFSYDGYRGTTRILQEHLCAVQRICFLRFYMTSESTFEGCFKDFVIYSLFRQNIAAGWEECSCAVKVKLFFFWLRHVVELLTFNSPFFFF